MLKIQNASTVNIYGLRHSLKSGGGGVRENLTPIARDFEKIVLFCKSGGIFPGPPSSEP